MHAGLVQRSCLLLSVEQGRILLFCLTVLFDKPSPDHSHKLERPRMSRANVFATGCTNTAQLPKALPQQQRMHYEYPTRIAHPCSPTSTITTASVNTSTSKTYATKYTAASYLITFDDDEDPGKTIKAIEEFILANTIPNKRINKLTSRGSLV
jgi:hypothetical protein